MIKGLFRYFDDHYTGVLAISVIVVLAIGTLFYHYFEGWRYIDSLYFSTIVLTTIGLGDFTPKTDIGKIFTIIYALAGIGIILTVVTHFAQTRLKSLERRLAKP